MRGFFVALAAVVFAAGLCLAAERPPAVAGSFYPAEPGELAFQVDKFLAKVPSRESGGEIIALIVPHAGYLYSGQTAAYAYKQLAGRSYDTVVVIGASHHYSYDTIAVPAAAAFITPLGRVPVDRDFVQKLAKLSDKIVIDDTPEANEHAIEVQLPFLQRTLKNFKIVPVLFGDISLANCQTLAYALSLLASDRTLIVISSDWSHYYKDETARKLDACGIKLVLDEDLQGFIKALSESETEACGAPAIITGLLLAPALGVNRTELVKYNNTGDATGDRSSVVGYAALVFYRQEPLLSQEEKRKLLKIARRTLGAVLAKKAPPRFEPVEPNLNDRRGVFVTLKEQGRLRGCIGYILPVKPLFLSVQETAFQAACHDSRFSPVRADELKELTIEISALSRLRRVGDVAEIKIGSDGLYIINGEKGGLLLPQVAVEQGWDRNEFLKEVCLKAGLPEEAWQDKASTLYRFTADVFSED